MVPDGWKSLKLSELSTTRIANGAFNDPEFVGSGYKLINVVDLYSPIRIRPEFLRRLNISQDQFEKYRVKRGDLFFTRSSLKMEGIAHCNIFDADEADVIYECHIMRIRPDRNKIIPKFLQEFCLSSEARKYFISHSKTGTMTTIDQKGIGGLPVVIPPLDEQNKIARILSTWDKAIETVEKLIENSKTQKKALMQQLLTGKRRFREFVGLPWEKLKVKDLVEIIYGKSPKDIVDDDGQYPIIGTGGVTGYTHTAIHSGKSVVIGRKGTIDKPQYIEGPFWAIDTTFYCLPKDWTLDKVTYL